MPSSQVSRYSRYDENNNYKYDDEGYNNNDRYQNGRNDDNRAAGVRRSTRIQEVSRSEIGNIRQREMAFLETRGSQDDNMALVRRSRTQDYDQNNDDTGSRASRRVARRDQYADDRDYNYRRPRRRESAPDYGYGGQTGQRSGRSERGSQYQSQGNQDQQQMTRYQGQQAQQQGAQQQQQQQNQQGQLTQKQQQQQNNQQFNQEKEERREDFMHRHFDFGVDGAITTAAGAALGAVTARHFGGPPSYTAEADSPQAKMRKNWKTIAGAVGGAVALNLAESKMKSYFEDERKQDMADAGEFMGEILGAVGPDVM